MATDFLPITITHPDISGLIVLHAIRCTLNEPRDQIYLFMQSKPNFPNTRINVYSVLRRNYIDLHLCRNFKSKPKKSQLKPNQTQLKPNLKTSPSGLRKKVKKKNEVMDRDGELMVISTIVVLPTDRVIVDYSPSLESVLQAYICRRLWTLICQSVNKELGCTKHN